MSADACSSRVFVLRLQYLMGVESGITSRTVARLHDVLEHGRVCVPHLDVFALLTLARSLVCLAVVVCHLFLNIESWKKGQDPLWGLMRSLSRTWQERRDMARASPALRQRLQSRYTEGLEQPSLHR